MKKNSIFKVVLLVILCVTACTWIFTSLSYSGSLTAGDRSQVGIFDLSSYLLDLFRYFPFVLIMALSIGVFYGVAYRIPAYRVLLDSIVQKFKGKENIFLVATIVIISAIVSVTGLSFGMLFVFPFVIALVLLMGYNKLVAASTTVGSVMVGLIGTTYGSTSVLYINYILGTTVNSEIITKFIILVVGIVLLAYNVVSYANKTKNDTDKVLELVPVIDEVVVEEKKAKVSLIDAFTKKIKSLKNKKAKKPAAKKEVKEEKKPAKTTTKKETKPVKKAATKTTTKKKAPAKKSTSKKTRANDAKNASVKVVKTSAKANIWPFVVIFDLALVAIALGTFDWSGVAKANWPTQALDAIRNFEIAGFPILSKILGSADNLNAFGAWGLTVEVPATIVLAACLLAFIYGMKFDKFMEGVVDGIKKAIVPAMVMFLAYLVLIIATYHPFQLNIAKFFMELVKGLNVVTLTIVAIFASLFNVDSIYAAQSTLPYVTSVITDTTVYPIIAVIWQAIYGLTMLVAPTSVILIGTLAYLEIPYTQWLKHIWKLFVELLVVLIVICFILTLI